MKQVGVSHSHSSFLGSFTSGISFSCWKVAICNLDSILNKADLENLLLRVITRFIMRNINQPAYFSRN
jgi:hypothetical protein